MLAIRSFIFLLILAFATSSARKKRMVNGTDATVTDATYQVSIQNTLDQYHFCGGVIIHESFVLTAAHCFHRKKALKIMVVAGVINLTNTENTYAERHRYSVESIIKHPQYRYLGKYNNDIAIMKVRIPFKFSATITPAFLPTQDSNVTAGTKLLATGWGSLKGAERTIPENLQKLEVTVLDRDDCGHRYGVKLGIFPTQFCTHDMPVRKGVCKEDAGGPLVKDNVVLGIISWSWSFRDPECASPLYPDIHVRVSAYVDWISSIIYAT